MQSSALSIYNAIDLADLQFTDGFWHADSAPVFFRKKTSLENKGRLAQLSMNDTFYVELWGGRFKGRAYFMKVIRERPQKGFYDCLWLTKDQKLFRNLVGQVMYSEVPVSSTIFGLREKKRKAAAAAAAITTGGLAKKQKLSEETTLTTTETLTELTEPKEPKELTEPKEPKELTEPKEPKDETELTEPKDEREPKEPKEPTEPKDETATPKRNPFPKFPQLLVDEKDKKDYSFICSKKLFSLPPKTTLHI